MMHQNCEEAGWPDAAGLGTFAVTLQLWGVQARPVLTCEGHRARLREGLLQASSTAPERRAQTLYTVYTAQTRLVLLCVLLCGQGIVAEGCTFVQVWSWRLR